MAVRGVIALSYRDYDSESSNVRLYTDVITAANFDATMLGLTNLRDAIQNITLGNLNKTVLASENAIDELPATSPLAQREAKWLVRYHDSLTLEKYSVEIPCADLTKLDANNRGYADLADADVAAFVTAFEAAVTPGGGGSAVVDSIQHVGRRG